MDEEVKEVAMAIREKLTKDEISTLCDIYDDGRIRWLFETYLIKLDRASNPNKYV